MIDNLKYLEQADAHANEGPLGEPAARSILAIALPLARAANEFCIRVEAGEIRSRRTYAKFCELLGREPNQ